MTEQYIDDITAEIIRDEDGTPSASQRSFSFPMVEIIDGKETLMCDEHGVEYMEVHLSEESRHRVAKALYALFGIAFVPGAEDEEAPAEE